MVLVRSLLQMTRSLLRASLCQFYRRVLIRASKEYREEDLKKPAIVFSPHFDDETLGCGGTIIKKKKAGADVKIAFMTDGGKPHSHLIPESEFKQMRARESIAAARQLGLNASEVLFLGFEAKNLNNQIDFAKDRVKEILLRTRPIEVFIPYGRDPHPDHLMTNRIVTSALQTYDEEVIIYEYPIWFWDHWPWTNLSVNSLKSAHARLKKTTDFLTNSIFGPLWLLMELRYSTYIGDVLELKRAALNHYKSQMLRIVPDPRWPILSDVSDGDFLECLFQEYEFFKGPS